MKDGLKEIIGREISAVVVAANREQPHNQVVLIFADGSYFEFYGDFSCAGGVDPGGLDRAVRYVKMMHAQVTTVYLRGRPAYFEKVEAVREEAKGKTLN